MKNPSKDFFRYLPISERERHWGLFVRAAGFESVQPGDSFPRPGHPQPYVDGWRKGRVLQDYAALYITRGKGEFHSKPSGARNIVAGNMFLLFPGVRHYYRPLSSTGWDDYWIVFNGKNIEGLVKHGFISPQNPVVNTGLDDVLLLAYSTLLDRLRTEPVGFEQLLAANVMEILAGMLAAGRVQTAHGQTHDMIRRAKSLLESQGNSPPAIEQLAASLGLSATHFYRVFKEHTGLPPYQYYLQLRMERAKQMLQDTTMNIKQIAVALSFESSFHFSRAFKLKTGMSPSEWRQQGYATTWESGRKGFAN